MLLTRLQLAIAGVIIALLLVATVHESVALRGFLWIDGARDKVAELQFENNEMREAIREAHEATLQAQREVDATLRLIAEMRGKADDKAKRIENAPLPGNCRTPREILELDI
jgi:hypothetical protein